MGVAGGKGANHASEEKMCDLDCAGGVAFHVGHLLRQWPAAITKPR